MAPSTRVPPPPGASVGPSSAASHAVRPRPSPPSAVPPDAPAPADTHAARARQRALTRYGVAILAVLVVTMLRLPLGRLLGNSVPFILYFPAVVFAGWFGGLGPGLVATFLAGYCAKTWFFEPVGTFTITDWGSAFRLLLFVASGTLISVLCGQLHRRTAELELERDRLDAKVRDRTRHLERALDDMEAFSYTVSHDIRSPLRSIHGFSELLLQHPSPGSDDQSRDYLRRIQNAITRLDRLVNDLLAFAKLSGQRAELGPVPLRAALQHVVDHSLRFAPNQVNLTISDCDHVVLAHETLLHQVLQNLLENAAKFVSPGVRPEIRVSAEVHGNIVRLSVADNGVGIDPADQQRLFRMFERAQGKNYSGSGIGLAIVDRAMAKMNGRVGVESQLGRGSRFWLELPRA